MMYYNKNGVMHEVEYIGDLVLASNRQVFNTYRYLEEGKLNHGICLTQKETLRCIYESK